MPMKNESYEAYSNSDNYAMELIAKTAADTSTDLLHNATGPVSIPMHNDYLFRALLQVNNKVLKGLISSLLHIPVCDISSVEVTNPIELGHAFDSKDFYLDVRVNLNNRSIINLEMQVINELNWPERSLSYLCRSFDNLSRGADYLDVMPVFQICFLDFTLFPDNPEFYATYKMMNVKNHNIYSDKFRLSVVDLTCIRLATKEDKHYGTDRWAALFKSTTWEEIKMLAKNNEYIHEASGTIYKLTQEEKIRLQCEAREENLRLERYRKKLAAKEKAEYEKIQAESVKIRAEYEKTQAEYEKTQAEYEKTQNALKKAQDEIINKNAEIARLQTLLEQQTKIL